MSHTKPGASSDTPGFSLDEVTSRKSHNLVVTRPLLAGSRTGKKGIGLIVAHEFLRFGIKLEVDIEILGNHAEVQHLRQGASNTEGRIGGAIFQASLHKTLHVIELRPFGIEGSLEVVVLLG